MNSSAPRSFAVLLVIWGFFNMAFPLWRAADVAQYTGVFIAPPVTYLTVGMTAVFAGFALLGVCARLDALARAMPPAVSKQAPFSRGLRQV